MSEERAPYRTQADDEDLALRRRPSPQPAPVPIPDAWRELRDALIAVAIAKREREEASHCPEVTP